GYCPVPRRPVRWRSIRHGVVFTAPAFRPACRMVTVPTACATVLPPPARCRHRLGADPESAGPSLDQDHQRLYPRQSHMSAASAKSARPAACHAWGGAPKTIIPFPVRPLLEVADILRAHGEAYTARHP